MFGPHSSGGGVEQRAGQEDDQPQHEACERRPVEPTPSGGKALSERVLRSHPYVAIAEQQGDEPHLGPEHDRGRKAVKLREHHQQAARENESEACYHPAVHAGKAGQLLGPVRRRWREPERRAIGRDGHAAPHQDADKMEIGHRGAHGRVAIQVRPPREELRYCRRRRHEVVLLKGFGNAISRCPDHGYSARIPAGILPWRPESLDGLKPSQRCSTPLAATEHHAVKSVMVLEASEPLATARAAACAKATADGQRSAGSGLSARATASANSRGQVAWSQFTGTGGRSRRWIRSSATVVPAWGSRPVSIS